MLQLKGSCSAGGASLEEAIASALASLGLSALSERAAANSFGQQSAGAAANSPRQQSPSASSFTCLAWLIKGLFMAGSQAALSLVHLPLSYLSTSTSSSSQVPSNRTSGTQSADAHAGADAYAHAHTSLRVNDSSSAGPVFDSEGQQHGTTAEADCIWAAAAAFELIPASQEDSVLTLSRSLSNVTVKPVWQQRFYTVTLQQLKKLLAASQSAVSDQQQQQQQQPAEGNSKRQQVPLSLGQPIASNGQQQQPFDGNSERHQGPLLLAMAYLLKGTPPQLTRADLPQLVGLLLTALAVLQRHGQYRDSSILLGLLQRVEAVMQDPAGTYLGCT